jgi:uncharacterized protein (TIGR02145 family)
MYSAKITNNLNFRSSVKICLFFYLGLFMISCFKNPGSVKLTTEIASTSFNSATVKTSIEDDGGSDIFQKGICWSDHENPTLDDARSNDGAGNEDFETIFTGMSESTWYIRAYAINGAGAGYGNEVTVSFYFATAVIIDIGDLTGTSAFFRANVSYDGEVLSRGICWSTSADPVIEDNKTSEGTGSGIFTCTVTGLTPGTTYHARAYASIADKVFYSDDYTFTTKNFPTVTTKAVKNAQTFIPVCGGDIINTGEALILHAGVCWSTHPSPTIDDAKTDDYIDYTTFDSDLSGLQPSTTYYIRAYATNLVGPGYGEERILTMPDVSVYDADNNPYSSVTIGTQVWTVENLRTSSYSNGDAITNITDQTEWRDLTTEAWSYYENDAQFENPYGKLYNWFAVNDSRNICPAGWHVPGEGEWRTLIDFLGGDIVAGVALKEAGSVHWDTPNTDATNSSGFTALPAGGKSADFSSYPVGSLGIFWSNTASDNVNAISFSLTWYEVQIYTRTKLKQFGFSVRCIKDN